MGEEEKTLIAYVCNRFLKMDNPYTPGCDFLFPVYVPWIKSFKDIDGRRDIPLVYLWFSNEFNGSLIVSVNGNWITEILDEVLEEEDPIRPFIIKETIDFIRNVAMKVVEASQEHNIPLEIGFRATNPPLSWRKDDTA